MHSPLGTAAAVATFLVFAFAYFFSALIRAITATLAPTLTSEFGLSASDLGLLAGGYFFGFALTQLPLGAWLDRHGPRRVLASFLSVAVLGCIAFALAPSFYGLLAARVFCGVGVSACLMAPLTGFRRWLTPGAQLRANSWMLMTGSFGMLASTLPVQWLMPTLGWRPLFWMLAVALVAAIILIARLVPPWSTSSPVGSAPSAGSPGASPTRSTDAGLLAGYAPVWRHPYFRRVAPMGFFCYGGLLAVQTLWAGPWMLRVAGYTPGQSAAGLFAINLCMLLTFWTWGVINPHLARRGVGVDRLMSMGLPLSFVMLGALIVATGDHPTLAASMLALYCMACSFVSLVQPAVGMAFEPHLAGRALSGFNLVIFGGVFVVQWGIGLATDALRHLGLDDADALRGAMSLYLLACVLSYAYFRMSKADNRRS